MIEQISYSEMEKVSAGVGKSMVDALRSVAQWTAEHPYGALGILGGTAAVGTAINLANKIRGAHQIVNEAHKRKIMDYQTQLLREIANNQKSNTTKAPTAGFKEPQPIIPPLR